MSIHCSLETLSAYVDSELPDVELRLVESHVERCSECRDHVSRLEGIAGHVRRLELVSVPATLVPEIGRRLRLQRDRQPLSSRIEEELRRAARAPMLAPLFALVFAFSVILYLFSLGVSMRSTSGTRMVIGGTSADISDARAADAGGGAGAESERSADEAGVQAGVSVASDESPAGTEPAHRVLAGRLFTLYDGVWTEEGVRGRAVDVVIDVGSGDELPRGLEEIGGVAGIYRMLDGGTIVEIIVPAPPGE
jgi:anti-sigma factor RsiW